MSVRQGVQKRLKVVSILSAEIAGGIFFPWYLTEQGKTEKLTVFYPYTEPLAKKLFFLSSMTICNSAILVTILKSRDVLNFELDCI